MDELLQKAPEAHAHLQRVADAELQADLGAKILGLGHVELYDVSDGPPDPLFGGGPEYTEIPAADFSPEQVGHHDRVGGLIAGVAAVTASASEVVEERKQARPEEEQYFHGAKYDVFEVAKELAYEQAKLAFEQGDKETEKHALETLFAVTLITPYRAGYSSPGCERQVRHAVAEGMATDVLEVAQGMHGIIAMTEDRGGEDVRSVPSSLAQSADLLRVATNTDFDDQLQHPVKLVAEGLPPDDVARRSEIIADLPASQIAALSRLVGEKRKNVDFAANLALQAVRAVTQENYFGHDEQPQGVAEVIGVLMDYAASSGDTATVRQANDELKLLRSARSAGLRPYRTNSPITSLLDRTMIILATEGRQDAVKALISSTPEETPKPKLNRVPAADEYGQPAEPQVDEPHSSTNLGWALELDGRDMTPQELDRVKGIFADAHDEKVKELRDALGLAGATTETVQNIILRSMDPDSALAITPEFWDMYNQVTMQGQYARREGYGAKPGRIYNLIEGGEGSDLGKVSASIEALMRVGLEADEVDGLIIRRLNTLREDARDAYLGQLVDVANELRETYNGSWRSDGILTTLSTFREPAKALALAKELYGDGDKAFEKMHGLLSVCSGSYSTPNELSDLDPTKVGIVKYIAEHSSDAAVLLHDMNSIRFAFLERSPGQVAEAISVFESSPVLREISEHVTALRIYSELLVAPDGPARVHALEEAFAGSDQHAGIKHIVDAYEGSPHIQKLLVGQLLLRQPEMILERSDGIEKIFGQPDMVELLARMPAHVGQILRIVEKDGYDTQRATKFIDMMQGEAIRTLTEEYLEPEAGAFIIKDILDHENPAQRIGEITQLYEDLHFIQQTGVRINFAAHIDEWRALVAIIPEGRQGDHLRRQVAERILLSNLPYSLSPFEEDPTQAIRIFTEVGPSQMLGEAARAKSFELIERLYGSETMRGFPSAKPGKLAEVFFDDEVAELYSQLYALKQTGDIQAIESLLRSVGYDGARIVESTEQEQTPLAELMLGLKEEVGVLRKQRKDAELWLGQYAKQPIKAVKLIGAWKSRPIALANGTKDNPRDILNFVAEKGVMLYAGEAMTDGRTDITPEEFMQYDELLAHLGSRYSPETTFGAIERIARFKRQHGAYPAKTIASAAQTITVGDEVFAAEILSADDPRGLTIGFDTGCCMTLGGASESCIWAGYEDARYSFFAVYDENGRLRAQSIMYVVEQDGSKVLVVDNIEANQGTNLGKIADVYRAALVQAIQDQGLDVSAIHLGTGYTPPEVIKQLPVAPTTPKTPLGDVYTDANLQRLLWSREASSVS